MSVDDVQSIAILVLALAMTVLAFVVILGALR